MTGKVIKDTKYCQILSRGKLADEEYTYFIGNTADEYMLENRS